MDCSPVGISEIVGFICRLQGEDTAMCKGLFRNISEIVGFTCRLQGEDSHV